MPIKKVGVVGCGLMGSGIAQVIAASRYETVVRDVSEDLLQKGFQAIETSLSKFVEKGSLSKSDKESILSRLHKTTALEDLKDCDLVIEAITENITLKKELFSGLDSVCKPESIFASNTSSLSITEMTMATRRAHRFVGLHFFNPVPLMALVEVVRTIATDDSTYELALEFVRSLNKTPIRAQDKPGFIVNRLLVPYLLDAIRALEEGVGTVEDIDNGMKLGCGYPMGPFTLLDLVGLDTTYYIANIMFDEFKEKRFAPPPLLKRMVLAGHWGRKTGKGFYDYAKKR